MAEYRIDDLARTVGTTVRNVRAYQDRGLLAPPRIDGRVGFYTDAHLARLRIIQSFLDRGYAMAQIAELLTAWEEGKDLADVIGLEQAVSPLWSGEIPTYAPTTEIRAVLASDTEDYFDRFAELGWIKPEGQRCLVTSPQLLNAFKEALGYGFSTRELIELHEVIAPAIDDTAKRMVDTAARHITGEHGRSWLPSDGELGELATMLQRLRQMTFTTVHAMLARAMEENMGTALAEHIDRVVAQHPKAQDTA